KEVTKRLAIVRRISLAGSSRYAEASAVADFWKGLASTARKCLGGACAAVVVDLLPLINCSTSRLIILPPGPLPLTERKSIPDSAAMRAANGETIRRPLKAFSACAASWLPFPEVFPEASPATRAAASGTTVGPGPGSFGSFVGPAGAAAF